jgi:hypothetical protein
MWCRILFFLGGLSLRASLGGCGERKPPVATAAVADACEGECADDEGGFFVGVIGGVVLRTADVLAGAVPLTADGFECLAGGGVAAGFGGEVSATPPQR